MAVVGGRFLQGKDGSGEDGRCHVTRDVNDRLHERLSSTSILVYGFPNNILHSIFTPQKGNLTTDDSSSALLPMSDIV